MGSKPRKAAGEPANAAGRIWLEKDGAAFLGRGRVDLLEQIAEHGSISAAARAMGMSYKAAWEAVDAMNNLAEAPLVVRSTGGRHGGGTSLTEQGRRVITLFRQVEDEYRRFLGGLSIEYDDFAHFYQLMRRFALKTSARNQFRGEVVRVNKGAVNAEVAVALAGGNELVAIITNESVQSLGLVTGMPVHAFFRESSVLLAGTQALAISARNRLCGTVVRAIEGAVNGEVTVQLPGGLAVTSIITNQSIQRLGLREGGEACCYIKASDVMLAVSD